MKNTTTAMLILAASLAGCTNQPNTSTNVPSSTADSVTSTTTPSYVYPDVITLDTANKMLSSYLSSINYQSNDTDLKSVTFNAGLLRKYLDSVDGGTQIVGLKVMFAHTLSYINTGHGNQKAGYKSGALTLLIAGYKSNGDYVFLPTSTIVDNSIPCPTNCPPGAAANALFITTTAR